MGGGAGLREGTRGPAGYYCYYMSLPQGFHQFQLCLSHFLCFEGHSRTRAISGPFSLPTCSPWFVRVHKSRFGVFFFFFSLSYLSSLPLFPLTPGNPNFLPCSWDSCSEKPPCSYLMGPHPFLACAPPGLAQSSQSLPERSEVFANMSSVRGPKGQTAEVPAH